MSSPISKGKDEEARLNVAMWVNIHNNYQGEGRIKQGEGDFYYNLGLLYWAHYIHNKLEYWVENLDVY
jgi:hypothetical protein